jgi:hypothetical protein
MSISHVWMRMKKLAKKGCIVYEIQREDDGVATTVAILRGNIFKVLVDYNRMTRGKKQYSRWFSNWYESCRTHLENMKEEYGGEPGKDYPETITSEYIARNMASALCYPYEFFDIGFYPVDVTKPVKCNCENATCECLKFEILDNVNEHGDKFYIPP